MVDHDWVFAVHATRPDDVGAVEVVSPTEGEAQACALDRSRDHQVLAVSMTRFLVGSLGRRHPVAWYADGAEQPHRARRPGRLYPTD